MIYIIKDIESVRIFTILRLKSINVGNKTGIIKLNSIQDEKKKRKPLERGETHC